MKAVFNFIGAVFRFLLKFWYLVFVLACVAGVGVAVALNGYPAWPFLIVLVGILWRTFHGLANEALDILREGMLPSFDTKYLFSLIASIAIDLLAMGFYTMTNADFLGEVSGLSFTLAFLVGLGEAQLVRSAEKTVRGGLKKLKFI